MSGIKVTPEMIEAGTSILVLYEASDNASSDECISAVYIAMETARRASVGDFVVSYDEKTGEVTKEPYNSP